MANPDRSRVVRYVELAAIILVAVALLFPIEDGLSVAGFFGDKTYLIILQDNNEIRSTGWLMSVLGVITLHNGNIASVQYHRETSFTSSGTYNSSWNGIVHLDGPESLTKFFRVNAALLCIKKLRLKNT